MTDDVADAFPAGGWEFTDEVAADFDRHVRQSVPFYDVIQDAVAELSDWLAPDHSRIVDLGVSTAETFRRITDRHPDRVFHFIGYDTSPAMLAAASRKVPDLATVARPIEDGLEHRHADLTLALFTLQFLAPALREHVLADAHDRCSPGGALIIAEKVRVPDSRWFEMGAELSWDYKAERGIPDASIRTKARAIRGVLRPRTADEIVLEILRAGWTEVVCLFRWHQWVLFGAFE